MLVARRNEIGCLLFKNMVFKNGLVLKNEPLNFVEMSGDLGGAVTPGEAKEFYRGMVQEFLDKML